MALLPSPPPGGAMRHSQYTISRHDVHRHAAHRLQTHLRLPGKSRRCPPGVLLDVVLWAAARLTSLFAAALRLAQAPSPEAVRKALLGSLPSREELERRLNRALCADLPRALAGTKQPLACDLTLRPYHGKPHRREDEVYRGQAKGGTSHFHAYATCYLALRGRRKWLVPPLAWPR